MNTEHTDAINISNTSGYFISMAKTGKSRGGLATIAWYLPW